MKECPCGIDPRRCEYHPHLADIATMTQIPETPEVVEDMVGELMLEAAEAREDPIKFFEFVMRAETREGGGESTIKVAAHQRVIFQFFLAHDRGVVLLPRDHAKTYSAAGLILWMLGNNPSLRVGLVSAAEEQAKGTLSQVASYIENSMELRMVFPHLRRARVGMGDWNSRSITVQRPFGIRHPSVEAFGIGSEMIRGKRWDLAIVDDVLSEENVNTSELRDTIHRFVQGKIIPCVDPKRGKVFFFNTAFHPDDTVHRHMRTREAGGSGWPSLVMRVDGTIFIRNTDNWDTPEVVSIDNRLYTDPNARYRLARNPEGSTLWPERYPPEVVEERKRTMHPVAFAQNYMNECRDDATSLCKQEYIDAAMKVARTLRALPGIPPHADDSDPKLTHRKLQGLVNLVNRQAFSYPIFVGVDLAFSKSDAADESSLFVLAVVRDSEMETPLRVPLWIEHGRWGVEELVERMLRINEDFKPFAFAVENNAAQEAVRKLIEHHNKTLVLKEHTTNATKNSITLGVPSIFGEMANGAWAIPHRPGRPVDGPIQKFLDQCLGYTPKEHTGDVLMSAYFARDLALKWGVLAKPRKPGEGPQGPGIASTLLSR